MAAGLARLGLRAASWPYGCGVRLRNLLYNRGLKRISRVEVPVVSIGNLTLGGTGKTPCVEYVGRWYRERDIRAAIVSRGYGSTGGQNDEAMLLEENLPDVPRLQGADRVAQARLAVEELETELVILDDGFQHRRLFRDLDVVLIDATRPPSRDRLFPRGTLREPASSLARAGAVLLTRCDQVSPGEVGAIRDWFRRRCPGSAIAATEHRPLELLGGAEPEPLDGLLHRPVAGFCGIGNPRAFRSTLESLGADVREFRVYADHHAYTRSDVEDLARWAGQLPEDGLIATTQKDWVKLRIPDLLGRPLRAVRIGLAFRSGQQEFDEELQACLPARGEPEDARS